MIVANNGSYGNPAPTDPEAYHRWHAVQTAELARLAASRPTPVADDAYDGPLPEVEYLSGPECDHRAGYHHPEA